MKIEAPQENKIVVELTREDMCELDITYEEMDYGNIETRRVIWTILDRARRTLRRDIDPSEKMLIETAPTPQGGCVLYFTVLSQERCAAGVRQMLRICKEPMALTYIFHTPDDLMDCAAQLRAAGEDPTQSSLFLLEGQYILRLQSDRPLRRCRMLLAEYGVPCAENVFSLAYLREHGQLLAEGDAIRRLAAGS